MNDTDINDLQTILDSVIRNPITEEEKAKNDYFANEIDRIMGK